MRQLRYSAALLLAGLSQYAYAGPTFIAQIPFEMCQGLICVRAQLDGGAAATLILDTGDAHEFITSEAARSHGWKLRPYIGKDGKAVPHLFDAGRHTVTLGPVAQSVDFVAQSARAMGTRGAFQGNLIYLLFKDRVLQIDYPRRRLRISATLTGAPRRQNAGGRLEIVNFHKWGPPIVVGGPFSIDGKRLRAQIDTGYTGSMLIYTAAIRPLGLSGAAAHGRPELFPFTDGGVTMLAASVQSEGFAGHLLSHPAVVYFPTPGVHEPENPFDATVGNALFTTSIVTFDFHNMTLDVRSGDTQKLGRS
ncbi:MAG: hypothetical protein ACREVO_12070 [Steroidobacteraceae bacterium]